MAEGEPSKYCALISNICCVTEFKKLARMAADDKGLVTSWGYSDGRYFSKKLVNICWAW